MQSPPRTPYRSGGGDGPSIYQIVRDYDELELSDGLYVLPDSIDLFLWHVCIFVRAGPYSGGIFRAVLVIHPQYPAIGTCPLFTFIDRPLHPLVDPGTGALQLAARFPKWGPQDRLTHVVSLAVEVLHPAGQELLLPPTLLVPADSRALRLYQEDGADFWRQARLSALKAARAATRSGAAVADSEWRDTPEAAGLLQSLPISESRSRSGDTDTAAPQRRSFVSPSAALEAPSADDVSALAAAVADIGCRRGFRFSDSRNGEAILRQLASAQALSGADVVRIISRRVPSEVAPSSGVRSPASPSSVSASSPRSLVGQSDAKGASSPSYVTTPQLLSIDDIIAAVDAELPVHRRELSSDETGLRTGSAISSVRLTSSPLAHVYSFAAGLLGAHAQDSTQKSLVRDNNAIAESALRRSTERSPSSPSHGTDGTTAPVIVRALTVHPAHEASQFFEYSEWLPARKGTAEAAPARCVALKTGAVDSGAALIPGVVRQKRRCREARRPASAPRPLGSMGKGSRLSEPTLATALPGLRSARTGHDTAGSSHLSTDTEAPLRRVVVVATTSKGHSRDQSAPTDTPRSETSGLTTARDVCLGASSRQAARETRRREAAGPRRPFVSEPPSPQRHFISTSLDTSSTSRATGQRVPLHPRMLRRRRVSGRQGRNADSERGGADADDESDTGHERNSFLSSLALSRLTSGGVDDMPLSRKRITVHSDSATTPPRPCALPAPYRTGMLAAGPTAASTAALCDPRDMVRGLNLGALPPTSPVRAWSGGVSSRPPPHTVTVRGPIPEEFNRTVDGALHGTLSRQSFVDRDGARVRDDASTARSAIASASPSGRMLLVAPVRPGADARRRATSGLSVDNRGRGIETRVGAGGAGTAAGPASGAEQLLVRQPRERKQSLLSIKTAAALVRFDWW